MILLKFMSIRYLIKNELNEITLLLHLVVIFKTKIVDIVLLIFISMIYIYILQIY